MNPAKNPAQTIICLHALPENLAPPGEFTNRHPVAGAMATKEAGTIRVDVRIVYLGLVKRKIAPVIDVIDPLPIPGNQSAVCVE